MSACAGYDLRSGRPCERTDTTEVIAGCVHEHIGPRDLCPDHQGDLAAGWMRCGNCHGIDGHQCTLRPLTAATGKGPEP